MGDGRPRTTSPDDDGLIKLGQEMVEWVKQNDPIHLSQWYSIEKGILYKEWKCIIQHAAFLPYYEKALLLIGQKYLLKDSPIEPNLKQRWQRVYFKELKEEEDETKEFEAQLKKDTEEKKQQSITINLTDYSKDKS